MQTTDISWSDDEDLRNRFFEKVDKASDEGEEECWIWTASVGSHGYGAFGVAHDDIWVAHRVSYVLEHGENPEGKVLCHTCDVPKCVNPDHIYAGSRADNLRDAVNRGQYPTGEDHFNAKLTESDVREIRDRYDDGEETQAELADEFGISRPTVSDIVRGEKWSHVE